MAELNWIVDRLNEPPFEMDLTLISFADEKTPTELLQILNDVLAYLDETQRVDVRDEKEEDMAERMCRFLSMLAFKFPHGAQNQKNREAYKQAFKAGNREAVYQVLRFLLDGLPKRKERAYLGRFLMPAEMPAEFKSDDGVSRDLETLQELQKQFKEQHKTAAELRKEKLNPSELNKEIQQLDQEKVQLLDKIQELKSKTIGLDDFDSLLEVTSGLRKEQENETRLGEQMREQHQHLQLAQMRLREAQQRLSALRGSGEAMSAEQLLERLRSEVEENNAVLHRQLPEEQQKLERQLNELQEALSEPGRTEADVAALEADVDRANAEIQVLREQVAKATQAAGQDRMIAVFRGQAAVQAKKRAAKEEELEDKQAELATAMREAEMMEARAAAEAGDGANERENFKKFAAELKKKAQKYKEKKAELNAIRSESVICQRTETLLKSRCTNVEAILARLEKAAGVEGHFEDKEKVNKISEAQQEVNKKKQYTLEDLSKIVTDTNQELKDKKNKLAPQIKELRNVRTQYTDLSADRDRLQQAYDTIKVGLDSQMLDIERRCVNYQEQALREESIYHELCCRRDIVEAAHERANMERRYEKGDDTFLPNFKTLKDQIDAKLQRAQGMKDGLMKEKKSMDDNASENKKQRSMFMDLKRLLQCKLDLQTKSSGETKEGGANVMSLEQETMIGGAEVLALS